MLKWLDAQGDSALVRAGAVINGTEAEHAAGRDSATQTAVDALLAR